MMAIFRREVQAYLHSAMAWILMGVYLFILGQMFLLTLVTYAQTSMTARATPFGAPVLSITDRVLVPTFWWMGFLLLFLLPLLTMRLIAEESRNGTLEMLFTYPLTEFDIVMGKFAGVLSVVMTMMVVSGGLFVALDQLVEVPWRIVANGFLGVLLMACAFISFGLWASSVSSNQVLAASLSYGGLLSSWLVVMVVRDNEEIKDVFGDISVFSHLQQMAQGTLSTHHLVYYLAWTALFLFLTLRMLESRKWSA